ncbi:polysaccharide biosynthesis/export family protein [Cyanobium sp. Morenito 9A2]|uniref:polysaccharide biosynthesis/export family protein n=1 Tax=Cyanobium sp. Morenito 9A2 TaxID=2823718 RepID=UPI0020CD7E53|nr:polysaccharide biosynthesis/export family protein [Cyanobium sp. Morenito 9A2]MCP9849444.1 polysaccharide export protein [Cyanobium sp. Morenito 9A2]
MVQPFALALLLALAVAGFALPSLALPLSAGDRLKVTIPEGEEFSGIFEVNLNGELELPYVNPIPVTGLEPGLVQKRIQQVLVKAGYFQPSFLKVSVNVVQWAPVEVFVSGSTFQPGRVLINEWSDAEQTQTPVQQSGQAPFNRFLSVAIRQAGGLMPTANVAAVELLRGSKKEVIDLSGVFNGEPFKDIPLIAGDRVIVPDTGMLNPMIVRPSQITPVGVKIFISNLTVPATSNATSAIGRDATSFPYGSRFSQAVVSGNCAGGSVLTNAYRRAVLVRTHSLTGKTTTLDKGVEELLRRSSSNDNNPYLMANDAVACYDSAVVNFRDVLGIISEIISPGVLLYDRFVP